MTTIDPKQPRPPREEAAPSAQQPAALPQQPAPRPKATRYGPTDAILRRGQKRTAGGWETPPAMLEPYKVTDQILAELFQKQGHNIAQVPKVLLDRYPGDKKVYITPTHHDDPDGIEIKRIKGKLYINLITALWEEGLLQPTNQKQRFDLETVPAAQSPSGHACLLLDLTKPRETRYIKQTTSKKKKNDGTSTN